MKKQALIIANGPHDFSKNITGYCEGRTVIALDGAYNPLIDSAFPVDIIIGDLDSITQKAQQHAKQRGISILKTPNQKHTDLEKAIHYLDQHDIRDIIIIGATGQRMDHTLHNLQLLIRHFQPHRPMTLITPTETIRAIKNKTIKLTGRPGTGIGLTGAPKATVSSQGLTYDMQHTLLEFGHQDSTSNTLKGRHAILSINGTALLMQQH